jgi:hypothetical protein
MRPLIIDGFAGGGASEGIRAALGWLLLGHLPSLLSDALLPSQDRVTDGIFLVGGEAKAPGKVRIAHSREGRGYDHGSGFRVRLRLRLRQGDLFSGTGAATQCRASSEDELGRCSNPTTHTPVSSDTPNAEGERAPSFGPVTSKEG